MGNSVWPVEKEKSCVASRSCIILLMLADYGSNVLQERRTEVPGSTNVSVTLQKLLDVKFCAVKLRLKAAQSSFELLWLNMPEFTFFYSTINFKTKKKDDVILNNIKRFSHCQFSREHRFKSHYYNHTAKICQRGASFFWKGERHTSSLFGSLGDVLITFSSTLSSELTFLSCLCFITLAGFFFLCMSINIKRAAGHQQQGDAVLASASEPKNLAQFIGLHKPSCWFRWRTLRDCTSVRRFVIFHPARPGSAPPNAASCRAARADYLCVAASWESLHNQTLFKDFAAVELVMASTMVRRTSVRGSSLINEVFIISCQPSLPPPSLLPFTHNTTMAQTPCFLGFFFYSPCSVRLRRLCAS